VTAGDGDRTDGTGTEAAGEDRRSEITPLSAADATETSVCVVSTVASISQAANNNRVIHRVKMWRGFTIIMKKLPLGIDIF
jgi:hypothetical protein